MTKIDRNEFSWSLKRDNNTVKKLRFFRYIKCIFLNVLKNIKIVFKPMTDRLLFDKLKQTSNIFYQIISAV